MRVFLFLFATSLFAVVQSTPCLDATPACREKIEMRGGFVYAYRSYALETPADNVETVFIMVHGTLRNGDEYFKSAIKASVAAGKTNSTLVIAPVFRNEEDPVELGELKWESSGWKYGDDIPGVDLGSFDVMDVLIRKVANRNKFPALKRIVVAGHSAGGQYVARYTGGTSIVSEVNGIPIRFITSNPSSYMYLNGNRLDSNGKFTPPKTDCADYDNFHYGLLKRNRYMGHLSAADIVKNMKDRDHVLLIGEKDVETEYLDMSCEAMLQGKNRFERGMTYLKYLDEFFVHNHHSRLVVVPNTEHDGEKMFGSEEGRRVVFQ